MQGGGDNKAFIDVGLILSKTQIGDRAKVADLGCGNMGHFVFPIAKIVGKYGRVYAVDILKPVLERIGLRARQEGLDNIETVWSNLEVFGATKIESSSLDSSLILNVLHQSHKRVEILREAIRMIKKDGKLVIVEWKNISSPFGPPPEERVKREAIMAAAPKLGLKLEEEFDAGMYHYGIVFSKL